MIKNRPKNCPKNHPKNCPKNRRFFGLLNLLKNLPRTFKNRPIGKKSPNLVTLLSFLLKIKITILDISLSLPLFPTLSLPPSFYLSPSLLLSLSLSPYLYLTGEEGVRTLFTGQ